MPWLTRNFIAFTKSLSDILPSAHQPAIPFTHGGSPWEEEIVPKASVGLDMEGSGFWDWSVDRLVFGGLLFNARPFPAALGFEVLELDDLDHGLLVFGGGGMLL